MAEVGDEITVKFKVVEVVKVDGECWLYVESIENNLDILSDYNHEIFIVESK